MSATPPLLSLRSITGISKPDEVSCGIVDASRRLATGVGVETWEGGAAIGKGDPGTIAYP